MEPIEGFDPASDPELDKTATKRDLGKAQELESELSALTNLPMRTRAERRKREAIARQFLKKIRATRKQLQRSQKDG